MDPLPVTLYSDFICPYCFLAERVLDRLARRYPLEIDWIGYEIHPELPRGGAAAGVLAEVFRDALWSRVGPLAEQYGVEMRAPVYLPNTHLALEAAEFAKDRGRLAAFGQLVFAAYFRQGMNIGEPALLRSLAERAGLDAGALGRALDEGEYFGRVEEHREQALGEMVTGVPTTIIDGFQIVGAQSEATFESVIEKMTQRRAAGART